MSRGQKYIRQCSTIWQTNVSITHFAEMNKHLQSSTFILPFLVLLFINILQLLVIESLQSKIKMFSSFITFITLVSGFRTSKPLSETILSSTHLVVQHLKKLRRYLHAKLAHYFYKLSQFVVPTEFLSSCNFFSHLSAFILSF